VGRQKVLVKKIVLKGGLKEVSHFYEKRRKARIISFTGGRPWGVKKGGRKISGRGV